MLVNLRPDQLEAIRHYAAGHAGTRATIQRAGLRDYADLLIVLAQLDLDLPKPPATPEHKARVARAERILQPRLRHGD